MKKYFVSFGVEGSILSPECTLNKKSLEREIRVTLFGDSNCKINNLQIREVN